MFKYKLVEFKWVILGTEEDFLQAFVSGEDECISETSTNLLEALVDLINAYNHFQKCWDTSRFSLKHCKTSTPLAPYSMLSRGCHIFVLVIDTQTSNPTLNGGAGEGEVKFFYGIIVERQM